MKELIVLVPVYNDSDCLKLLCENDVFKTLAAGSFEMLVVNDGSTFFDFDVAAYRFPVQVIQLHANVGHQKALAIGLAYIFHHKKNMDVVVMDADGEDNPADIPAMLSKCKEKEQIVVARRVRRHEKFMFRLGYRVYKLLFRVLTGYPISFGNFAAIPGRYLGQLVYKNDIWNHLAAGILKSNLPFISTPLQRKPRYAGESKMRFSRLVLHGLGAITVFIEYVSTRLLIFSMVLLALTVLAIAGIISIKAFSDLAIPGWASTLTGVMMIIFLQSFLLTLSTLVLYLSAQSQRQLIPAVHYEEFISSVTTS